MSHTISGIQNPDDSMPGSSSEIGNCYKKQSTKDCQNEE